MKGLLDAHHIVPLSESRSTAFMRMNGVTLCRNCHVKTKSFAGHAKNSINPSTGVRIIICSIPTRWQEYKTCGNYQLSDDGSSWVIFVSEMDDARSMVAVAIHELFEMGQVVQDKIPINEIDQFDIEYEKTRIPGDNSEPGDDPKAPYFEQHQQATSVELIYCLASGMTWSEHERIVEQSLG